MTEEPRKPGSWPVPRQSRTEPEPQHDHAEQARTEMVKGSIRAHLEEQPSEQSIRACARLWQAFVAQTAEAVINDRRHP